MLSRRQIVALICAAIFVVSAVALAIVKLGDGAWVQGVGWAVAATCFGFAYGLSYVRWRRT